ncbi:hypothetical protein F4802DRAFT_218327 [Xylaria palmicola]|nr:hypothetical protein F4802DRAFT_218327 [Xylaria palmicola]
MASNSDNLQYTFNHLFLPSKLPQQDDYNARCETSLLSTTIEGLNEWRDCTDPAYRGQADAAISSIRNMKRAYSEVDGSLNEGEIISLLAQLTEDTPIPLYVWKQNAGVLISRQSNRILFDIFEVWPTNEETMTTKGRLRRSFPGVAVVLDESDFQQNQFQKTIAHTLADMSRYPVEAMQPKVKKADSILPEARDTNHPGTVSELLVGFLRSIGKAAECPAIAKNMRDDVLWNNARLPWRRSPSWLVVRVALQLGFHRKAMPTTSDTVYKEAMLLVLSYVLKLATEQSFPSELLSMMNAKLSRRLLKIGPAVNDRVLLYVREVMRGAHDKLSERWSMVQKQDVPERAAMELSDLDFISDCYVPIPDLDNHIKWMGVRKCEQNLGSFEPPSTLMIFPSHALPRLPERYAKGNDCNAIAGLEAFEIWVALHGRQWSRDNKHTSCNELSSLIVTYHNLALLYYSGNPEALSVMLLTVFELWIACDGVAVNLCPLLSQYDPGIPCDVLQNLLLPFASQMQRLRNVEQYLSNRSASAQLPPTSLYYDLETPGCFPVQYFDQSTEMQATHRRIVKQAEVDKQLKLTELLILKMKYNNLVIRSNELEHEYENILVDFINRFYERQHKSSCAKCRYSEEAEKLHIEIHEWPLPRKLTKAKSVIFELRIPSFFQSWRQATFYVLRDVIRMRYSVESSPRSSYSLASDPHLPSGPSAASNIGLLSEDKPQVSTHRHGQPVSIATETSICVNNGLNYRYFDFNVDQFIEPFAPTQEVLEMCTYYLPSRSESLQKYLFRPATSPNGPSSNVAIADQSETPAHMSVEEARDLAMLPLGHHIQHYNVLVQLAAPSLDFRKDETEIFALQCLYQAGPSSNTPLRASHAVMDDERFAFSMLENVTTAWHRVKENWESAQALGVFSATTRRLLSLTSSERVKNVCLKLLNTLCTGGFAWVELLRHKSHEAATQDDGTYLRLKSVDVALICISCFDVEERHLREVLSLDINASIFAQCSILIQEGKRVYDPAFQLVLACLSLRFRRLLYRSLPMLSTMHSGISDAVQKSWSAYRSGDGWRVVCNHWLVTETEPDNQGVQFQVHYDLLSGELLVNGIPLSRPPRAYEDHTMWRVLFGQTAVEVMPTSAPGMQFSAKREYKGHNVRFGKNGILSEDWDLIVQASHSGIDYETIPSRLLQGLFPDHFIKDFVHWYNHKNATLEFRPREMPWNAGVSTWILSRSAKGWTLKRNGSIVLGMKSRTATTVADMLLPLADKSDIHTVLQSSEGSSLEVEIPALRLGFFFTAGQSSLRSREFPGMFIDDDQSLGTLVGFVNKMVLRDKNRRLVLVPEGPVSWESVNNHIRVRVLKASITTVHPLYVDSVLGRLRDNGNLQGKLFLSYLHALTSHCLPDPLTNRTGVEQALSILNSAAVLSFDRLSSQNIEILVRIAGLCPVRQYYPGHERVMQTVSWVEELSSLSHHAGLYKAAGAILEQARQMSLFYPGLDRKELEIRNHIKLDEFLIDRDCIRTSTFRVSDFGAEDHTTAFDVPYRSRDRDHGSVRESNAYVLSSILYQGHTVLHSNALRDGDLWRFMLAEDMVFGPNHDLDVSQLKYGADAINSGLDLSLWPAIHRVLSTQADMINKFDVMIWLSAVAAHRQAEMRLLQVLALFFTTPELGGVDLPCFKLYYPAKGYEATFELLKATVYSHLVKFSQAPEGELQANPGELWNTFRSRRYALYLANQKEAIGALVKQLRGLWPNEILPSLRVDKKVSEYIKLTELESVVRQQFKEWYANLSLFEYSKRIEKVLSRLSRRPYTLHQPAMIQLSPPTRTSTFLSVRDFFASPAPTLATALSEPELQSSSASYRERTSRLVGLLDNLGKTADQSRFATSYIEGLRASMRSLQEEKIALYPNVREIYPITYLCTHLDECRKRVDELYIHLTTRHAAANNEVSEFGQGPRLSPILFLQRLSSGEWKFLDPDWRICITRYALALSALQRAERLVRAASLQSDEDFIKELKNVGHRTWDPLEHPEWLLLEVESSIIIRDVQEQIASEMIDPRSHCNAVLQLNMGEGKSSVIVPMVAAELANGSQLARVIVAKPQSKQMAQMLISKLGGLLNRRVYYMPFSRALKANSTTLAGTITTILRSCQASGGVMLVQPEHLLSFQLIGIEYYCDEIPSKQAIGKSFIHLQNFLDTSSRDIVDESDENFSPKFELIYTIGFQQSIELSPARWICMQQVLNLVRSLAAEIADELPKSIEVVPRSGGGFPRVRILKEDAGELLVRRIARRICDIGLDGFPISRQQEQVREAVFKYISRHNLTPEEITAVEESGAGGFWTESTKPLLLLLRGILAGGVLTFALSRKRWRVDFGLATDRTPPTKLAVPYRAKDNPTPRSEFSHPDIVIALTSLTYYYSGLENEDLFIALGHLMDSDQASLEYDAWIQDSRNMPVSFRQLEGINLKDRLQCINNVFPYLRYGKTVVDYFLGHVVFPKEMKEFPFKLSASGWDIGKSKAHYTTGFSGTNDSRKVLPLDMKNLDLPSQNHTNALVLEYLLQPENLVLPLPERAASVTYAQGFLDTINNFESPIRVILDVGAQILELNNQEVARDWLQMVTDSKIQAAIFVNDDDELTIIDRRGNIELFQTSSYATRLDACLVFLDEAHTRGIDLILPDDYRAAVTLGANLTKDRLVQACMRLRKLGRGQSVVFCVGAEIRNKILSVTAKPPSATIEVQDVLHWAVSETFAETERSMPLWAAQGVRFLRQEELRKSAQTIDGTNMSNATAMKFLDNEAQSIEARYRPGPGKATSIASLLRTNTQRVGEVSDRCSEFEHLNFNSTTLEEEQERELSPETEQERQQQRPDPARPAKHSLHPDVTNFVDTGRLLSTSPGYMSAFEALRGTKVAGSFEVSQLDSGKLLVTKDFAQTVESSNIGQLTDSYQRPVQWILSRSAEGGNAVDILMVISPHEAEHIMPKLQSEGSNKITLHLYKPRYLTGYRSFDDLDFFTVPAREPLLKIPHTLRIELNLFAGQLYFNTYADYRGTCTFLGLAADVPGEGELVAADGYILHDAEGNSKFDKSPVQFLHDFTSNIRRNGQSISKTHAGGMLEGKLLQNSDFER